MGKGDFSRFTGIPRCIHCHGRIKPEVGHCERSRCIQERGYSVEPAPLADFLRDPSLLPKKPPGRK
jgi:hypothetical protein